MWQVLKNISGAKNRKAPQFEGLIEVLTSKHILDDF